jgi:hypothetical protein
MWCQQFHQYHQKANANTTCKIRSPDHGSGQVQKCDGVKPIKCFINCEIASAMHRQVDITCFQSNSTFIRQYNMFKLNYEGHSRNAMCAVNLISTFLHYSSPMLCLSKWCTICLSCLGIFCSAYAWRLRFRNW